MSGWSWQVALLSAAISTLVGTLVSLLAVSQTTIRRAKAERRDAARQQLHQVVNRHRLTVKQYRYGMNPSLKRAPNSSDTSDHQFASLVLQCAASLAWWRRFLIRRRLRTLVGSLYVDWAEISPEEGDLVSGLASLINLKMNSQKDLGIPTDALYHRAFSEPPESQLLHKLEQQLARLGNGW